MKYTIGKLLVFLGLFLMLGYSILVLFNGVPIFLSPANGVVRPYLCPSTNSLNPIFTTFTKGDTNNNDNVHVSLINTGTGVELAKRDLTAECNVAITTVLDTLFPDAVGMANKLCTNAPNDLVNSPSTCTQPCKASANTPLPGKPVQNKQIWHVLQDVPGSPGIFSVLCIGYGKVDLKCSYTLTCSEDKINR